jgi:DNA-binding response OmpR family regulator
MIDAPRVLLVEDEPVTRMMLEARLRSAGYTVLAAASGEAALALLQEVRFDLMITDLHLDSLDGVTLMAEARALDPELELIILTGGATLASAVAAVNIRAHAYIFKPVAAGDLERAVAAGIERRRAQLEHSAMLRQLSAALQQLAEPPGARYSVTPPPDRATYQVGALAIHGPRRRATVEGRALTLSSGEFDLLLYLAARAEQVLTPEQIARELYHHSCTGEEARELVKSRVHRLRAKLAVDPRSAAMLVCVRGAGYMLTASH